MNQIDAIVAGTGIWGCTIARRLAESGKRVLLLEKRPAIGGNVRCEIDPKTGIEIHKYGSHIFHTHIPEVWEFINRFVKFNGYQHKVLACHHGKTYFLPLGLSLINKFFGVELKPSEASAFLDVPPHRQEIFNAFFRGYTSKQWGQPPESIDPSIIKRVPVRSNYDTNYFNDYNQGIPITGYNSLFDRLLDHPNITLQCNCALVVEGKQIRARGEGEAAINPILTTDRQTPTTYYSGPIDALFNYKFGHLPWRTLRFELETLPIQDYQGTSVVNYPDLDIPFTRIHEFAHYHPESGGVIGEFGTTANNRTRTVIMREYSSTWQPGDEPYYPVNTPESTALLARYQEESQRFPSLVIGGRLGAYRYLDMDQSMNAALTLSTNL